MDALVVECHVINYVLKVLVKSVIMKDCVNIELELYIIWRGSIRTSIISTTRSHTISTSSIELGTRTAETPD